MVYRRAVTSAAPLFAAAGSSYAVTAALGTTVALKLVDTRRIRWVHHAMYIVTFALTVAAIGSAWLGSPRRSTRQAGIALLPALVPLGAIPYAGTHTRRHPIVALTAAPFFVAGVLLSRRPANWK